MNTRPLSRNSFVLLVSQFCQMFLAILSDFFLAVWLSVWLSPQIATLAQPAAGLYVELMFHIYHFNSIYFTLKYGADYKDTIYLRSFSTDFWKTERSSNSTICNMEACTAFMFSRWSICKYSEIKLSYKRCTFFQKDLFGITIDKLFSDTFSFTHASIFPGLLPLSPLNISVLLGLHLPPITIVVATSHYLVVYLYLHI